MFLTTKSESETQAQEKKKDAYFRKGHQCAAISLLQSFANGHHLRCRGHSAVLVGGGGLWMLGEGERKGECGGEEVKKKDGSWFCASRPRPVCRCGSGVLSPHEQKPERACGFQQ